LNRDKLRQKQRITECIQFSCPHKNRCLILLGNDCIKQEGKRIPMWSMEKVRDLAEVKVNRMKAYWIEGGLTNDEGREF